MSQPSVSPVTVSFRVESRVRSSFHLTFLISSYIPSSDSIEVKLASPAAVAVYALLYEVKNRRTNHAGETLLPRHPVGPQRIDFLPAKVEAANGAIPLRHGPTKDFQSAPQGDLLFGLGSGQVRPS